MPVSSYRELADRYVRMAQEQERKADARKEQIRRKARGEATRRMTPSERRALTDAQFDDFVEGLVSNTCNGSRLTPPDPQWQRHVNLNQWYIQQAIMYSTAANGETLQQILNALTGVNTGRQIFSSAVFGNGQETRR